MIAFLKGDFINKNPASVLVDVQGVGYEVQISLNTYSKIQHLEKGQRPRWYDKNAASEYPIPSYGDHDLQPPANREVWQPPRDYRDVTLEDVKKA